MYTIHYSRTYIFKYLPEFTIHFFDTSKFEGNGWKVQEEFLRVFLQFMYTHLSPDILKFYTQYFLNYSQDKI